jgi:hypothetical protein
VDLSGRDLGRMRGVLPSLMKAAGTAAPLVALINDNTDMMRIPDQEIE